MEIRNQAKEKTLILRVELERKIKMFHTVQINAGILKLVSSTSFGDTASCRTLNTTNIIDPSNQLSCTAYMFRTKDKSVMCQLKVPTNHELYVSGHGTIDTNCTRITRRQGFE
ncbi:hypothetical protein DPMN_163213 [Dreissena polymorpha]|uniref:Uncharacterized protein n=1 Tax=Dreissena polymorpha TaxID=45954 RepID=A0A9D4ETI3_DREPO|nr:hypothetical protein DPMN_163213 [Dreissena polymorpha]